MGNNSQSCLTAYQEVDLFSEIRGSGSSGGGGGGAGFGAVMSTPSQPPTSQSSSQFMLGGDILQPQAAGPLASKELLEPAKPTPGLARDVDSSLAKAAANLSMSFNTPRPSPYSQSNNSDLSDLWGNLVWT